MLLRCVRLGLRSWAALRRRGVVVDSGDDHCYYHTKHVLINNMFLAAVADRRTRVGAVRSAASRNVL
jgi:hypothetical protein